MRKNKVGRNNKNNIKLGNTCHIGRYFWIYDNGNNSFLRIGFDNQDINTADKFKTWLSNNNVKVYYPLKEPLDLPCTSEQIDVLENKPSTYKDFTIINSEDETKAYLEVAGIYDLNKLITRTEVLESES